ncbi:uroporphyrinogen decarboxylase/cobalamine-independent methonine synthase family protein [Alkalibacter mobilis]|uniref:uroporphyrinogen decarboxylase family protein n=1 Tax=Alkalibacter mobilis TaxID=2787712 RepID=UPI00189D10EC|nr:uroporphyrinogen decarboxylase family protein [Alkalibacter mobilis]MBF7097675.1 hypothetical protein [Alkalibacter mobilis]
MLKPHLSRIVEAVTSRGVIYQHHNCGYWASIAEDLIEIGVKATDPTHPCNNLTSIKERFGKELVFFGGFNSQLLDLPDLNAEDAKKHVEETFQIMAPGGGWVPVSGAYYGPNVNVINDEITRCANEYYGVRPSQ